MRIDVGYHFLRIKMKKRHRRSLLDSDEEEEEKETSVSKKRTLNPTTLEGLPNTCEFLQGIKDAGLSLDPSRDLDKPHKLQCEQAMFQKKLEKYLDGGGPILEMFHDQFVKYLEASNEVLLKGLMPVRGSPDSCQEPESLLRILLNIECLQPSLSSFLLEKLAIISLEFEDQRTVCYFFYNLSLFFSN